jgi:ethanolamine permease
MSKQRSEGLARYESVRDSYLRQRKLKGSAGAVLLWGLGVGAVISGNFFGWNFGLAAGGFWGLFLATLLMSIMYVCMIYSVGELSAALPHAGGLYSFTRNAFGPFLGFICGVATTIEYILTPAAIVVSIGDYLQPLIPSVPVYVLWLLAYTIFVAINIWSVELTLNVGLLLTLVAIMVLVIFYLSILIAGIFIPELLFTIPPDPGQSANWLPKGWQGIFAAIPYAIWFYLAIEQVPLAAEETGDVARDMPKALASGIFTLVALSLFTLVLNSGVGGGAVAISQSNVPLAAGLEAYFGKGSTSSVVTTIALSCGVIASFHCVIYAYGRVLFSLSRAGYLPRWISVTGKTNTPYRALLLGAVVGFICAAIVEVSGDSAVGTALLNMAVFGAVISYFLVMVSYIKLKLARPDLPRPYSSPLGIWGAAIGVGLAIFALFACFSVPNYRPGFWGVAILLVVATLYFLLYSKNHLVAQAPEEKAALIVNRQV